MSKRSMRIFGAVVLVPTSMPTWHMMPMKLNSTMGLPNRLKQAANCLPTFGATSPSKARPSSWMGVASSMSEAAMPMSM